MRRPEKISAYAIALLVVLGQCNAAGDCPAAQIFGTPPPANCPTPTDPLKKPASGIESWFTEDIFNELFPKSNLGLGPNKCLPYNYQSFIIAARYFPEFGTDSAQSIGPNAPADDGGFSADQLHKRDLAAFFAHAIQETGENDISLYSSNLDQTTADACFYKGGLYNWFEGGPVSQFLPPDKPGSTPSDGDSCQSGGLYCVSTPEYDYVWPCNTETVKSGGTTLYKGCYLGRGAVQISYNFNYGQFQGWLNDQGLGDKIDVLKEPNLVMTSMNPPLALMASLWFFMTPQPPKPAIHDIIVGNWNPGSVNNQAGYKGPIFGPSSLIINNECNGEDPEDPGGAGESRRIKAFKWFCGYFGVPYDPPSGGKSINTLSCQGMPQPFDQIQANVSWQPDWSSTWKEQPCDCAPASYGGVIPYFMPGSYPKRFTDTNAANRQNCVDLMYADPATFSLDPTTSPCLNHPPK